MSQIIRYFFCFVFVLFVSCRKDVGSVNRGDYPVEIGRILESKCTTAGCHNSQSYEAAGGLNLETWESLFKGSSSGSPVIPYSSRFSSLCYFINTFPELGTINKPTMPYNKSPLSYDEVQRISNWINDGAPNINGEVKWAKTPQRKKLYAVNQGCDIVTVFDSETQLPIRYIEVGNKSGSDTPHHVRVSNDGQFWYVVFINNNVMQKFKCSDDSYVGDIPLTPLAAGTGTDDAFDWNTFVISDDNKTAYCVSWTSNGKVCAVDLENRKLKHYLSGLYNPHGIALNGLQDKIYITAQTGNYISEVDTGFTYKNDVSLEVGAAVSQLSVLDAHDIILSANKKDFLITCQKSNEVRVFNIAAGSVTNIVPTGLYPQEIVYSKGSNDYFISCTNDSVSFPGFVGSITKINGSSLIASKLQCGFQPHGIAVDESKRLLYVLSRNISSAGPPPHHSGQCAGRNGFVNFVDITSYKVTGKKYELSVDPYFIYARP